MKNKEKIPLTIGLSIPLLMVFLLAASIYLPALSHIHKRMLLHDSLAGTTTYMVLPYG